MPRKPLANLLHDILGDVPIRVVAYDGSASGPVTAGLTVHIRSPKALSYLLSAPVR
jgi:cyclopropane-fatty-acyl-phospholipid synthase